MGNNDWFVTGEEAFKRAQQYAEEIKNNNSMPMRFFLKPGQTAKVTFLDTHGFGFMEHNLKLNGRWHNYFTCRRDFSECPLCDAGDRPSFVVAWTVIDHSKYTSERTGQTYSNKKKLLVAKQSVVMKIKRRMASKELGGDLTYAVFAFTRDGLKEAATGEDIEFIKRLSKEEVLKFCPEGTSPEEFLKPFDYKELFLPKSVEELRRIVGEPAPIGASSDKAPFAVSNAKQVDGLDALLVDDVPF